MNLLVVVLLGGLWAALLLPGALRSRSDRSPLDSVDRFERSMVLLARTAPGMAEELVVTTRAERAAQRRRMILQRLIAGVLVGGVLGLTGGGWWWAPGVVAALATGVYLALLWHWRARQTLHQRTVRRLPARPPAVEQPVVRVRHWGG